MAKKLTDNEVYDLLHKAEQMFAGQTAETGEGERVLETIRRDLSVLQLSLITMTARRDGEVPKPRPGEIELRFPPD